jgi:hypothetical protein
MYTYFVVFALLVELQWNIYFIYTGNTDLRRRQCTPANRMTIASHTNNHEYFAHGVSNHPFPFKYVYTDRTTTPQYDAFVQ